MVPLLSDEDFNGNVVAGIRRRYPDADLVRVQEVGLSGRQDPDILAWAAAQGRCLLTNDRRTMVDFAMTRLDEGLPMPGLFVLRPRTSIHDAIEAVAMIALASDPADWAGRVEWIPFSEENQR
jgi:predicted nuclease of predicted toxin-antitoxin system